MRSGSTVGERGVAFGGAPINTRTAVSPFRSAAEERAGIVAYLHGLSDRLVRDAFAPGVGQADSDEMDRRAGAIYQAARAIEAGEHWK